MPEGLESVRCYQVNLQDQPAEALAEGEENLEQGRQEGDDVHL